jgi:ATP-dependent protease ClpP protease subunit
MEIAPIEVHEAFSDEIWPWSSREALLQKINEHAYHGVERIVLDVSSPGGEVASTMVLFKELSKSSIEVVTRATGEVASMGVVLFLAGDRRLASPEATFLVHPVAVKTPSGWPTTIKWLNAEDMSQLRAKAERSTAYPKLLNELDLGIVRLARQEKAVRTVLEQRTKLTGSEIEALVQQGEPMDAAYAKAMGIVHEIVPASRS